VRGDGGEMKANKIRIRLHQGSRQVKWEEEEGVVVGAVNRL
jgi:hypothetical protein